LKFVGPRPFADPAPRALVEIASTIELAQDGRIYIELVLNDTDDRFWG
jgi:hypothetical protein